jgi:hypothetical protein
MQINRPAFSGRTIKPGYNDYPIIEHWTGGHAQERYIDEKRPRVIKPPPSNSTHTSEATRSQTSSTPKRKTRKNNDGDSYHSGR